MISTPGQSMVSNRGFLIPWRELCRGAMVPLNGIAVAKAGKAEWLTGPVS